MPLFEEYATSSHWDEAFDTRLNVNPCWRAILDDVEAAGLEGLRKRQEDIDWHLEDNGVTYNIYENNEQSSNRSWKMDPIPFVIAEAEWEAVKKGLKQRANLLNLIFRDLYSEQKLIKENIIPAEVIYGHKGFAAELFDFGTKANFNLYFYAADIARGPDGKMWVVNDRTQAPSGLGYALENRLTMNVVAKTLYPDIPTKKLYPFFESFKSLLGELSGGDLSTAALLTPGPHNETYFEHAYLSSFFEIPSVQGADLLSKNGALWLKSLSGLKKITTLLRRVDDRYCDPLELRDDSKLGVAGLVESMRQDHLNMINPVGSAILENIGLNPFMEKIADYFLNEKLLLPQIATWWCGQKKERDFVLENLDTLIIKKIDRTDSIRIYFGKKLSSEEKAGLRTKILKNPYQYAAQEEISFSTVPFYGNGKVEPRNAVIRAFSLKQGKNYSVMNGGLVRVAPQKDLLTVSSQKGATSKDLWILTDTEEHVDPALLFNVSYVETSIDKIPTPKAENLFWLGRYLSRAIATTRLISHLVKRITNFYRYEVNTSKESQEILQNALTHMSMTYPGFLDRQNRKNLEIFPMIEITSVVKDVMRPGSLAFTMSMLANANLNLKDLLAFESWKLFEKMHKEWEVFINRKSDTTLVVADQLDLLLIYLVAYKELVTESIFKEQGLILYDIGSKIECTLLLISKARAMLCLKLDKAIGHDVLSGMLNSIEAFNAYRAQYRSALTHENVVDFLILNPQFPKSLTYMTNTLLKEFQQLPKANQSKSAYVAPMLRAQELLRSSVLDALLETREAEGIYTRLDALLMQLSSLYLECSDAFSHTYFSHTDE